MPAEQFPTPWTLAPDQHLGTGHEPVEDAARRDLNSLATEREAPVWPKLSNSDVLDARRNR